MKTFSLTKFSLVFLLISLPFNFILAEGVGSVYLSTAIIFINFLLVFVLSNGKMITKKIAILGFVVFGYFLLTTIFNFILDRGVLVKEQLVFSIIHSQLLLVFILANYYADHLNKFFLYKIIIGSVVIFSSRIFIDDLDKVFNLSSVRGLRVETLFAGGANNFALLVGIGFLVSFFYLKKGIFKFVICGYLFGVIILTMSRGALLGLIFSLFVVALFDPKGKILSSLLKISTFLFVAGFLFLIYSDIAQELMIQFSERFLSLFSGDTSFEQASSGRGLIIRDLYYNHIKHSSFFEILFGHGMGSINFKVLGSPYESSHNIIVDVFYRNGLIVILGFITMFIYIFINFIKNRQNEDLVLFSVFVFLHFEVLVNPFVYAAQSGWIYGLWIALIINRRKLRYNNVVNKKLT